MPKLFLTNFDEILKAIEPGKYALILGISEKNNTGALEFHPIKPVTNPSYTIQIDSNFNSITHLFLTSDTYKLTAIGRAMKIDNRLIEDLIELEKNNMLKMDTDYTKGNQYLMYECWISIATGGK